MDEVTAGAQIFFQWVKEQQDPSLTLKIEKKWSSTYTDNRLLLRKDLFKRFNQTSLLDLNETPKNLGQNVSISHCPVFGGYVISDRPIGFDIEQRRRISKPLVKRICDTVYEHELLDSYIDDLVIFWGVKESAYKSLRKTDGHISEIKIKIIEKIKSPVEVEDENLRLFKVQSHYQKQFIKTYAFIDLKNDVVGAISYPTTN